MLVASEDGEGTSTDQIYNFIFANPKEASEKWAQLRPEMVAGAGGEKNPKYQGWSPEQFQDVIDQVDTELTRGRWPEPVKR
jgi:hypothetical protein